MSKDHASFDEELDAQLTRMRQLLKLMAPESGTASALGAETKADDRHPSKPARELTEDKSR